jgi:FdhE protein
MQVPVKDSNVSNLANFHLELLEIKDKLNFVNPSVDISSEVKNKWLEGTPILAELQPIVEAELFHEILLDVARACQKWQPGPHVPSKDIISKIEKSNEKEIQSLANAAIKNSRNDIKKWAQKLEISKDLLEFLTLNSSRPFLQIFASEVLAKLDLNKWTKGYCPICGSSPVMARLTKDKGVRKLYCSCCETEWRYSRIGCPFCESKDSAKISFIRSEDYKQYRLYLCDECKSYLKTVDERECSETDLFCEDLATMEFDRLAISEGYQRGSNRYYV